MMLYKKLEEKELNNTWKFLNYFSNPNIRKSVNDISNISWFLRKDMLTSPYTYRKYIINIIQNKYTCDDFYKYEKISNKLFWNLKIKLGPYILDNKTKYTNIKNNIETYIKKKYKFIPSFINSYLQYNEKNKKWYLLKKLSELDSICMNIMMNKSEYEKYYNNPEKIKNYDNIINPHYFMNYPFPNINPMFYNENKKSIWVKKIKKMYYFKSPENEEDNDKYWYSIIV